MISLKTTYPSIMLWNLKFKLATTLKQLDLIAAWKLVDVFMYFTSFNLPSLFETTTETQLLHAYSCKSG